MYKKIFFKNEKIPPKFLELFTEERFEELICEIEQNSLSNELSVTEMKILAFGYIQIFTSSHFQDTAYVDKAIPLLEKIFVLGELECYLFEEYINLLEITYQYKKAFCVLKKMLNIKYLERIVLKYLSSPVYMIEGLQTHDDCIAYKKRLIDLTNDSNEQKRLLQELDNETQEAERQGEVRDH